MKSREHWNCHQAKVFIYLVNTPEQHRLSVLCYEFVYQFGSIMLKKNSRWKQSYPNGSVQLSNVFYIYVVFLVIFSVCCSRPVCGRCRCQRIWRCPEPSIRPNVSITPSKILHYWNKRSLEFDKEGHTLSPKFLNRLVGINTTNKMVNIIWDMILPAQTPVNAYYSFNIVGPICRVVTSCLCTTTRYWLTMSNWYYVCPLCPQLQPVGKR